MAYYNISFAYQVVMGTLCTFHEGMHFQLQVKGVCERGLGWGVGGCCLTQRYLTKTTHFSQTAETVHRQQHISYQRHSEEASKGPKHLYSRTCSRHGFHMEQKRLHLIHTRLFSVVWQSLLKAANF